MVKGELRNFMIVITRECKMYLVRDEYIVSRTGYEPLSNYNRDLTHSIFDDLDIMLVYSTNVWETFDVDLRKHQLLYDRFMKVQ